jgi:hypothetical protein
MDQSRAMSGRMLAAFAAVAAGLMLTALPVLAANTTVQGQYCMQRIYMGPGATVSGSNLVVCTANDIRLSKAISVSPDKCTAGTTFDLTATFQVDVTANSRYDAAFFFRTDGGTNARGDGSNATGQCSVTQLDPTVAPALNLDGDTCGDLNSGTYTNVTFTIPNVLCQDSNGDGFLNLPNCTSWHSNQGTACSADGNPFDANPDTKSKCVCDDTFQVPVHVEVGSITATKDVTAGTPTSLPEPGGQFDYTISVHNDASVVSVTIDKICDDKYGTIANSSGVACVAGTLGTIDSTTCVLPKTLAAGGSYSCSFKAKALGEPQTVTDTVTFSGTDQNKKPVSASDSAQVTISNVAPTASVVKSLDSLACADVNYRVKVTNSDQGDTSITLTSLIDNQFCDLTVVSTNTDPNAKKVLATTCAVPQTLTKGGTPYECTFKAHFCAASDTNLITAIVGDNEGGSASFDSNSLKVNVCANTSSGTCP